MLKRSLFCFYRYQTAGSESCLASMHLHRRTMQSRVCCISDRLRCVSLPIHWYHLEVPCRVTGVNAFFQWRRRQVNTVNDPPCSGFVIRSRRDNGWKTELPNVSLVPVHSPHNFPRLVVIISAGGRRHRLKFQQGQEHSTSLSLLAACRSPVNREFFGHIWHAKFRTT